MRRLFGPCAVLIILGSVSSPGLAQSPSVPGPSNTQPPAPATAQSHDQQNAPDQQNAQQPADPKAQPPAQEPKNAPDQPNAQQPADPNAQPPAQKPTRPKSETPGVRTGGLKLSEAVSVGGYGSVRYEKNNLDDPKPSGFDFRRFVLTTEATPNDRLQAYIEIEFERLADIEVERAVQRFDDGVAVEESLEGGNGGEISIEQMWGQYKFSDAFSVRFGQILPPVGRFNINHDDDRWDIPRRTLVDRNAPVLPVPVAWTELGVGAQGGLDVGKTGRLTYQAYLVNGAILDFAVEQEVETEAGQSILKLAGELGLRRGPVNGEGGTRAGTWRVAYSPTLTAEIGVSGYHGKYTPEFMDPVHARLNVFGVDGLWKYGSLAVEGEYIHTDLGNTDRVVQAFIDAVTGSTGRAPRAGAAGTETEFAFVNITPKRHGYWVEGRYRFWREQWKDKFLGRDFEDPGLNWVVRYERATLDDALNEVAIEGGDIEIADRQTLRQERTTVGLAYRPIQSVVFSVAVEHNRRLEGPVLIFPRGHIAKSYTDVLVGMAFGF